MGQISGGPPEFASSITFGEAERAEKPVAQARLVALATDKRSRLYAEWGVYSEADARPHLAAQTQLCITNTEQAWRARITVAPETMHAMVKALVPVHAVGEDYVPVHAVGENRAPVYATGTH